MMTNKVNNTGNKEAKLSKQQDLVNKERVQLQKAGEIPSKEAMDHFLVLDLH